MVKKVLFLSSLYKPNVGGVETSIHELSQVLAQQGVETKLVTKRFPPELSENESVGTIDVFRFNRPKKDAEYLSVLKWLISNSDKLKSDIIHVMGVRRPIPFIALLLARLWKVPLIITFAGGDLPDKDDPESKKIWNEGLSVVPQAIRQADAWSAFSRHTANQANSVLGGLKHISTIYGGVNAKVISASNPISQKHPYFFSARRLEFSKGIDILLEAFAGVANKLSLYELIIAGDGSERATLEKQTQLLGISDRVKFIGKTDQSLVFSYMKSAVAHICPSRAESGGLVNWEAQTAGCLAIASDVDGIPEYVSDGKTGLLFRSGDIQNLREKLLQAAMNNKNVQQIKARAFRKVNNYSWVRFANRYMEMYGDVALNYSATEFKPWSEMTEVLYKQLQSHMVSLQSPSLGFLGRK